ncbi:Werner syndrome ATP-dependent helicase homolog [Telopea speciosissima]|uniref:Werner syndrome ATP-dependent helicase homolog n=1 Tax=Telopea speciosissima TaxID=54955 RepID=UPI001CC3A623|nr:Werner syndrome ATP-dependent helicase homolog [Telopea speciosissima]
MNDDNITIYEHENGETHLRQTFTVTIFGIRVLTTVTRKPSVVRKWVYKIRYDHRYRRDRLVVGLGVQWRPPIPNPVSTLQLCVGRQCLIFQIIHANSIPRALKRFLSDDSTTFVGVRNQNDSRLLIRNYNLFVNRILELGSIANLRGASMEMLASGILGFHDIKKDQRIGMSEWDYWWLSEAQIQYACVDAYLSFEIGKNLNAWKYDP